MAKPKSAGTAKPAATPAHQTLAEKVDHLFTVVRPAKGEYTHEQVAKAIEERGGPTISATYLWQLRKGQRDNPTMKHLEALSSFFGVPPAYFFDDARAHEIDTDLDLHTALRDDDIRQLALRAAGLSPATLAAVLTVIERARQLEALTD